MSEDTPQAPATVRIDVWSDVVCPWCYIGKRRLERLIDARSDLEASVHWHPFQLNPGMPAEGMDRGAYLAAKFGGEEGARAVYARVEAAGAGESIPFAFEAIARAPNTVEAHRLVAWAASQPAGQDAMVEALFEGYFVHGEDVGDREALAMLAGRSGFDEDEARAFLDSGIAREEVIGEDRRAREIGMEGVPCFVIDGKVAIPGAAEPAVFNRVFEHYGIGAAPGA